MQCCSGHPNTPHFFGAIYGLVSNVLPSLVMSLSTVGDSPITLQSLLKGSNSIVMEDCTLILLGKLYKWYNLHDMFNCTIFNL